MVCISHEYRFVYLKTHKTASTSAEMFLERFCTPEGHVPVRDMNEPVICERGIVGVRHGGRKELKRDKNAEYWFGHMAAKRVRRQLGKELFDSYLKVACVRNPYRRLLSKFFYNFVWRRDVSLPQDLATARQMFRDFLENWDSSDKTRLRALPDTPIVSIDGKVVLDHVLRTEHLKDDMRAFLTRIGAPTEPLDIPRERDNSGGWQGWDVMDFFDDPRNVELAQKIDGWMFELGGYSRDPRDAQRNSTPSHDAHREVT